MNIDQQFKYALSKIVFEGTTTQGRTATDRHRLLTGINLEYDCSDGTMGAFTLRKNNPDLAIAETLAFLMGAGTVQQLEVMHPALKLWQAWAADNGSLGGVYGDAFHSQYGKIISGLKVDPLSTHHRMTTLLPSKFPLPGEKYNTNVLHDKFSLMPCLHSYHFLSDGEYLTLHATQASGDMPVGVFPHNVYQVQFMLLLTAKLTGLKPLNAVHHIHDAHIYTNQLEAVEEMMGRDPLDQKINLEFADFHYSDLVFEKLSPVSEWVKTSSFETHDAIKMNVDS